MLGVLCRLMSLQVRGEWRVYAACRLTPAAAVCPPKAAAVPIHEGQPGQAECLWRVPRRRSWLAAAARGERRRRPSWLSPPAAATMAARAPRQALRAAPQEKYTLRLPSPSSPVRPHMDSPVGHPGLFGLAPAAFTGKVFTNATASASHALSASSVGTGGRDRLNHRD
jgi:hypothetical protein